MPVHAVGTFLVRSLSDQLSVTVTDAASGSLLGNAILPLDKLRALVETRVEVPLEPYAHQAQWDMSSAPADVAPVASSDATPPSSPPTSPTTERAPALVLTMLPLTFGLDKDTLL